MSDPTETDDRIRELLAAGTPVRHIMRACSVGAKRVHAIRDSETVGVHRDYLAALEAVVCLVRENERLRRAAGGVP